jgi:hypothetical protein
MKNSNMADEKGADQMLVNSATAWNEAVAIYCIELLRKLKTNPALLV